MNKRMTMKKGFFFRNEGMLQSSGMGNTVAPKKAAKKATTLCKAMSEIEKAATVPTSPAPRGPARGTSPQHGKSFFEDKNFQQQQQEAAANASRAQRPLQGRPSLVAPTTTTGSSTFPGGASPTRGRGMSFFQAQELPPPAEQPKRGLQGRPSMLARAPSPPPATSGSAFAPGGSSTRAQSPGGRGMSFFQDKPFQPPEAPVKQKPLQGRPVRPEPAGRPAISGGGQQDESGLPSWAKAKPPTNSVPGAAGNPTTLERKPSTVIGFNENGALVANKPSAAPAVEDGNAVGSASWGPGRRQPSPRPAGMSRGVSFANDNPDTRNARAFTSADTQASLVPYSDDAAGKKSGQATSPRGHASRSESVFDMSQWLAAPKAAPAPAAPAPAAAAAAASPPKTSPKTSPKPSPQPSPQSGHRAPLDGPKNRRSLMTDSKGDPILALEPPTTSSPDPRNAPQRGTVYRDVDDSKKLDLSSLKHPHPVHPAGVATVRMTPSERHDNYQKAMSNERLGAHYSWVGEPLGADYWEEDPRKEEHDAALADKYLHKRRASEAPHPLVEQGKVCSVMRAAFTDRANKAREGRAMARVFTGEDAPTEWGCNSECACDICEPFDMKAAGSPSHKVACNRLTRCAADYPPKLAPGELCPSPWESHVLRRAIQCHDEGNCSEEEHGFHQAMGRKIRANERTEMHEDRTLPRAFSVDSLSVPAGRYNQDYRPEIGLQLGRVRQLFQPNESTGYLRAGVDFILDPLDDDPPAPTALMAARRGGGTFKHFQSDELKSHAVYHNQEVFRFADPHLVRSRTLSPQRLQEGTGHAGMTSSRAGARKEKEWPLSPGPRCRSPERNTSCNFERVFNHNTGERMFAMERDFRMKTEKHFSELCKFTARLQVYNKEQNMNASVLQHSSHNVAQELTWKE